MPIARPQVLSTVVILILGVAGTGIGFFVARKEADRARRESIRAGLARSEAEKLAKQLASSQDRQRDAAVAAYISAGDFAVQRGKWRAALKSYDQALAQNPPDPFAIRMKRVRPLVALTQTVEAREQVTFLLSDAAPKRYEADVMMLAGAVATEFGEVSKGLEYFRKALATGKLKEADSLYAKAVLSEDIREAIELTEAVLSIEPFRQEAHDFLIVLYALHGDLDRVRDQLAILQQVYPEDPDYHFLEAMLLVLEDRRDEAHRILASAGDRFTKTQSKAAIQDLNAFAELMKRLEELADGDPQRSQLLALLASIQAAQRLTGLFGQVDADRPVPMAGMTEYPLIQPFVKAAASFGTKIATFQTAAARDELGEIAPKYRFHELYLMHGKLSYSIAAAETDQNRKREELIKAEDSLQKAIAIPRVINRLPPVAMIDALGTQTELIFGMKLEDEQELAAMKRRARDNVRGLINIATDPSHRWQKWVQGKAWMIVVAAVATGQLDQAREMAAFWIAAEPENANAHEWLARVEQMQGHYVAAIRAANKAIELDSSLDKAKQTRLETMQQLERAVAEFQGLRASLQPTTKPLAQPTTTPPAQPMKKPTQPTGNPAPKTDR